MMLRVIGSVKTFALMVAVIFLARPIAAQVSLSPTTPRLEAVVQLAQEGNGDSARAMIAAILKRTPTTDPVFPEALYTSGIVAKTGDDTRTAYKRVVVEYPGSAWADKALLRLAELSYGNGDMDDVLRRVTMLFTDYPSSPVIAMAALWGSRAALDQQRIQQACDWLTRGLAVVGSDLELKNQLQYAKQRCNVGNGVQLAPVVPESLRAGPPPRPAPDTAGRSAPVPPPPAPPAPAKRVTASEASPWRIQVAAVSDKAVVARLMQKIEAAGFKPYTVPGPKGLTKVQAGPFASRAAAVAALDRIRNVVARTAFITPAP